MGMGIGDWGLGIGDWGLGIGPNPQSPLHPTKQYFLFLYLNYTSTITYKILRESINYFFFQGNHRSFLIGLSNTSTVFTTSCLLKFLIDN